MLGAGFGNSLRKYINKRKQQPNLEVQAASRRKFTRTVNGKTELVVDAPTSEELRVGMENIEVSGSNLVPIWNNDTVGGPSSGMAEIIESGAMAESDIIEMGSPVSSLRRHRKISNLMAFLVFYQLI